MYKPTGFILFFVCIFFVSYGGSTQHRNSEFTQELMHADSVTSDSLALELLEEMKERSDLSAKMQLEINHRIVARANSLRKFTKAIALGYESIVVAERNDLDSMEALFNKLLGASCYFMDRKKESIGYFKKAAVIAGSGGYWELEASCYNNMGGAYADIQEYDLAEPNLLKAIEIMNAHDQQNARSTLRTYRVLARTYSESGKPEKAEPLYLLLIEKSKAINDTVLLSDNLMFYSEMLSTRGELRQSVEMSALALELIRKRNDEQTLMGALNIHSNNLAHAGQFREAHELVKELNLLMRKVFASNLEKEISELEVKYKTEQIKRDKELTEIKARKQQQVYLFSFAGILLVLGSAIYVWNQRRNSRQHSERMAELAETEKQRFKAVLEAEEKERSRIARELHDGLGQMLSTARLSVSGLASPADETEKNLVKNALKIIDESCEEVRTISHNMMPGSLIQMGLIPALRDLFENINASNVLQVHFVCEMPAPLEASKEISLYRIIQEMLNNIIRHAKAKNAYISIVQKEEMLYLNIKDDGIGFSPEKTKISSGIGWKNIYLRVAMFNGTIQLESPEGEGLSVSIAMKI